MHNQHIPQIHVATLCIATSLLDDARSRAPPTTATKTGAMESSATTQNGQEGAHDVAMPS
eukprot:scaffold291058_cov28-Tisochrysis_lutea.AAC.2